MAHGNQMVLKENFGKATARFILGEVNISSGYAFQMLRGVTNAQPKCLHCFFPIDRRHQRCDRTLRPRAFIFGGVQALPRFYNAPFRGVGIAFGYLYAAAVLDDAVFAFFELYLRFAGCGHSAFSGCWCLIQNLGFSSRINSISLAAAVG